MSLDPNPVFRRVISPWYDSDMVCLVFVALMGATLVFGLAGIQTVFEIQTHYRFIWIPLLVSLLSGVVLVSISSRLIMRYILRRKENVLMSHTQYFMK